MEPIPISYTLTEQEIRLGLLAVWKKKKRTKTLIFAGVFLFLAINFFMIANYFLTVVCLGAAGAIILVPLSALRNAAAQAAGRGFIYRLELEASAITVDVREPEDSFGRNPYVLAYQDVVALLETQYAFLLVVAPEKIIPIPKRALDDEKTVKAVQFFESVFAEKFIPLVKDA